MRRVTPSERRMEPSEAEERRTESRRRLVFRRTAPFSSRRGGRLRIRHRIRHRICFAIDARPDAGRRPYLRAGSPGSRPTPCARSCYPTTRAAMWLAADPFFGAATANETVLSALAAREAMFGAGVFSTERFLYEAVGTLYWLRWSPPGRAAVHAHDDAFVEEPALFETDADVDADADADAGGERRDGDARRAPPGGGNARRLRWRAQSDLAQCCGGVRPQRRELR